MKVKKINKFATELPKKSAFMIDTEPDFIKLHTLCIASGKRGGGKSVAIANLVKKAKDAGYFDKVYLITPTYNSNKQIWAIADIQEEDVYEPDMNVLKTIIANVEAEKAEWDAFLSRKKLLKQFKKDMKTTPYDKIGSNSMLDYLENGFFDVGGINEEWKYKNEVPPRLALVIDDSMGTDIMLPSAGLTKFVIAHRHWGEGLGISVFMLVQSYTAGAGQGLSRPIREQTTQLWLFKIAQENQLKKVFEESDLEIDYEKYLELCNQVHSVPYNFLMIDFNAKDPEKKYRNGFKEFIKMENKM